MTRAEKDKKFAELYNERAELVARRDDDELSLKNVERDLREDNELIEEIDQLMSTLATTQVEAGT